MIGRLSQRKSDGQGDSGAPRSYDDYEVRLGDMMRGERATMGKSLLDVQRELRIKASYIAAIENCDPTAFDTPGFIAGYVRSYARYLNMDPDVCFDTFCTESGFTVAHGMSSQASSRKTGGRRPAAAGSGLGSEAFTSPSTPFVPATGGLFSQIDPRAIGSLLVVAALIGGIGYGGWTVLKQVQQVKFAPVDQTPLVLAELDPLESAVQTGGGGSQDPAAEALDRLYRPQALDVPVLMARDAPISSLDPRKFGAFAAPEPALPDLAMADAGLSGAGLLPPMPTAGEAEGPAMPQVVEPVAPSVEMIAVRPSWVRVTAADGSVIFETIMDAGQRFEVPMTEEAPVLRTGESSAIYFDVNGTHYGPVGKRGQVTKNIEMSVNGVTGRFQLADMDLEQNRALAQLVAQLQSVPAAD